MLEQELEKRSAVDANKHNDILKKLIGDTESRVSDSMKLNLEQIEEAMRLHSDGDSHGNGNSSEVASLKL